MDVRPLVEMTGSDHFCEVFFDGARTSADHVVGAPGRGWEVAMGTLGFERGTAYLAQQLRFAKEFELVVALARAKGATGDPMSDSVLRAATPAWRSSATTATGPSPASPSTARRVRSPRRASCSGRPGIKRWASLRQIAWGPT